MRFCVLGYPNQLRLKGDASPLDIEIFQKPWTDIEERWPRTQGGNRDWQNLLVNDLFESLGQLNIQNFKHRETNDMKIRTKLTDSGRAFRILYDTSEKLGFVDARWEWESWYCGSGGNADRLLQKLKPGFPKTDDEHYKDDDGVDRFNIVVRTRTHKFSGDRDWFLSVFRTAGLSVSD